MNTVAVAGLTREQMVEVLRHRCETAGSQSAYARQIGIQSQYISNLVSGNHNGFSEKLAEKMGYRRLVIYVPIEADQEDQRHDTQDHEDAGDAA